MKKKVAAKAKKTVAKKAVRASVKSATVVAAKRAAVVYAGFWRRLIAFVLDIALFKILTLWMTIQILDNLFKCMATGGPVFSHCSQELGLFVVQYFALLALYFCFQLSSQYQATFGMRALGLKITDLKGQKITFLKAFGRFFMMFILLILFPLLVLAFLPVLFTKKRQALYDVLTDTIVVKS
ncbi:RDD family protein [Candidatus Nucleicultrix amoebiphila]|jgi:uncharacterized RDD family membrane protein YckC|uniref:RDD domain-containing protein n=1 Tax=Candidatus Nucleicultrix amoebiphila FS5 TaxID=1414854 RepID=A0A1W6N3G7_9PROT|nr:RDD family protein [Candidatus Nucleicultrix amoebiphila]ARN84424.1 hypothetical protein GQ61_02790 [Candidatus Nucleicultrix amoebiphila FS5]